ncbi:hypothetical protein [Jannaschia marina]|uniref:hypothetical protein n=1 Tax=Jannaschia marina TaxID=2741674 RepID=UPI0015CAEF43|nr:hypothetical protein [Jannaschia marina]
MPTPGQLTKKVAATLGVDETTAATAWRVLREAGEVTKGGRGRSAAQVTARDAAKLIFAICGSNTIKDAGEFIARADTSRGHGHRVADWAPTGEGKIGSGKNPLSPAWELQRLNITTVTDLPTAHSAIDVLEGLFLWMGSARYNIDPPEDKPEPPKLMVKHFTIAVSFESPAEITRFQFSVIDADDQEYFEEQFYAPSGGYHYDGRNLTDYAIDRIEADGHPVRRGDMETERRFSIHTLGEVGRFLAGVTD